VIAENNIRQAARQVRHGSMAPLTGDPGGEEASGGTSLRRDERFDRLQAALDELDPDSRKVIVLARIEGLPIKEVAKRMGRSPNATSILLYRAAIKLKERFGDTESLSLPLRRPVDRGSSDES
jgi:RNA polymerase sigma-70 factor (ECF subfamily)